MYNDNSFSSGMYPTGFGPVLPFYGGVPDGYAEMNRDSEADALFRTGEFSCREEAERYLYELEERNNAARNAETLSDR